MAGVKGDFGKLRKLRDNLKAVGAEGLLERRVSNVMAVEAVKLIADGFRKEQDPYGEPWAPLKSRTGRILRRSGRMAASANAHARPGGGVIGQISVGYAIFHQRGAHHAARSDARMRTLWRGTRSGRFLRQRKGGELGVVYRFRRTTREWDLPRRMMVPERSRGLGPIWGAAFARVLPKVVRDLIKNGWAG